MSAASLDNPGDIIIRQGDVTNWQNVIDHADPVARFADEVLLSALGKGAGWPQCVLTLTPPDDLGCSCIGATHSIMQCFVNWKITVTGANASYVYIIKHYDSQRKCWIGAWPD